MNKQRFSGLVAFALVAMASSTWAVAGGDRGRGQGSDPVSIADVKARGVDRAQQMDGNRDGTITPQELLAYQDAQRLARAKARLERFDTNKDGQVTVVEMADARAERLAKLDTNKDGSVTRDEFRAGWAEHGGRHHGHHGGRDHGGPDAQ